MSKIHRYAAAGGVVIHRDSVLLLDRPNRNEVRLPKGHVEEGESVLEAALREVIEETGYAELLPLHDLGTRLVEFEYKGIRYERTESYFLMGLGSDRMRPRDAQDSAEFNVKWVPLADAAQDLTYFSEQAVVTDAIQFYNESRG